MQLSPYGGLGGLRGELMSNNPYQPKPGMAQQLNRQQMSAPDMSGHRADVQARYGLTDEETTAAIESRGQSLGGRSPVPGATSYDGTPLRPQEDPSQMIGAARPSPYDLARMGPMIEQAPRPPQNIGYQPIEEPNRPGFAKPLSPAPSEQGTGGGLAEQEWRLKIEPVEMNMGGRIPSYQNGGDIDFVRPEIPEPPLFSERRPRMGGRFVDGVPTYGQEEIDAGLIPFPMGYMEERGVLMRSPGTPKNKAALAELDRTFNIEGDPLDNLRHMMELRKLYYEPTEDNPEGWPMPTTRRYGNGGIIGLAHGGMVPDYAHGGEVPGYFLGGLLKGIKSLGKKGLQYAPQIMGLIGEEIPGFNKLSSIGRAAVGALAKQGSRKASGQDLSFQDMLGDAGRTYAMESAKDRIRDALGSSRTSVTPEEGFSAEGDFIDYEGGSPAFVADETDPGWSMKDIFTDSDAARTALEAALDIPVGEALALGFTEQEKKRGQRGESTGHLGGFDPMSTVGRVMPPSMSGVPGRSDTSARDIASQLTYGNMPVDYTGRAEGGIIPEYQYGGMYGEEGEEFDPQGFYVPQSPYPPPRSQMLPDPGMLGEGEGEQGGFLNADPGEYGTSLGPTLENTYNMDPYGALPPEVLSGERDLTKKEIDERAENAKTEIDRQRTQLRNQSKKSEEGEPDDAFVAPDDPMAQRAIDDAKTPSGKYDEDGNLRIDTEYTDARTGQYTPATYTDPRPGRVMPPTGAQNTGSAMSYGPSNQFSGVGSGFYGENKWFDPNAEEVAAKEISGLDPHQLPRTASDFQKTGDKAGADLLSRLGKADGGMVGSANPMLQNVSPEDMQALMMASVQLDSPNSRDVISDIMRKYNLSATDLNQMLETLMAQAQTMQEGGLINGGGGDAMSDDIYVNAEMEANGQTQPIAVSSGEYIVPGDVVSHLGSGNTEGGADVMDQFIEDVRVQRTGTPVQPDPIDLSDVLPDTYGDRYA